MKSDEKYNEILAKCVGGRQSRTQWLTQGEGGGAPSAPHPSSIRQLGSAAEVGWKKTVVINFDALTPLTWRQCFVCSVPARKLNILSKRKESLIQINTRGPTRGGREGGYIQLCSEALLACRKNELTHYYNLKKLYLVFPLYKGESVTFKK